jgi:hypothetical protein
MSNEELIIVSRYNVERRLGKDTKSWYIAGESLYMRYGTSSEDLSVLTFIDFDGGPMISVGQSLATIHKGAPPEIITKIEFDEEKDFYRLYT